MQNKSKTKEAIFTFLLIFALPFYAFAQTDEIRVTVTLRYLTVPLVLAPQDKTADPVETANYNFTVQNVSNISDTYDLSVNSSQRWKPVISSGAVVGPLAPQESIPVTVVQTIPLGELAGTQDTLTLTAISQTDRNLSGADSVITIVNQIAAVTISISGGNNKVRPGQIITLRATISNEGNGNDTFQLSAFSTLGWSVEFPEGNIVGPIEPKRKVNIPVRVTVPQNALSGQSNTATITATSQFDPLVSGSASTILTVR